MPIKDPPARFWSFGTRRSMTGAEFWGDSSQATRLTRQMADKIASRGIKPLANQLSCSPSSRTSCCAAGPTASSAIPAQSTRPAAWVPPNLESLRQETTMTAATRPMDRLTKNTQGQV